MYAVFEKHILTEKEQKLLKILELYKEVQMMEKKVALMKDEMRKLANEVESADA